MEAFKNTSMMIILAGIFYGAYQMVVSEPPNWRNKAENTELMLAASDPSVAQPNIQPQNLASGPSTPTGAAWNPPPSPNFTNPTQFDSNARLPINPPALSNPTASAPIAPWPAEERANFATEGNRQAGEMPSNPETANYSRTNFNENDFSQNPMTPGVAAPAPSAATLPPSPTSSYSAISNASFASPSLPDARGAPASSITASTAVQPASLHQPMDRTPTMPSPGLPSLGAPASPAILPIQPQPVNSSATIATAASTTERLKAAMEMAAVDIQNKNWPKALRDLSAWYQQPLGNEDREHLIGWLDRLAGEVIYSNLHTLAAGHQIQAGESLATIATRYQMPARLLARINQYPDAISDETPLQPGVELKVVPGPFTAEADMAAGQLTLYAGGLYAGRFQFRTGESAPMESLNAAVSFVSQQGIPAQEDQRRHEPLAATNPFGRYCLVVGQTAVLHSPGGNPQGSCLQFSEQDMLDLMVLLPRGTNVRVIK
jgi:hypothetical protein